MRGKALPEGTTGALRAPPGPKRKLISVAPHQPKECDRADRGADDAPHLVEAQEGSEHESGEHRASDAQEHRHEATLRLVPVSRHDPLREGSSDQSDDGVVQQHFIRSDGSEARGVPGS